MAVTTVRVCDSERTVFGFILNKAIDLHAKPGVSRGALAGCGTSMGSAGSDTSVTAGFQCVWPRTEALQTGRLSLLL